MEDQVAGAFGGILKEGFVGAVLVLSLAANVGLFWALMSSWKSRADEWVKRAEENASNARVAAEALTKTGEVMQRVTAGQEKAAEGSRDLAESNRLLHQTVTHMINILEKLIDRMAARA